MGDNLQHRTSSSSDVNHSSLSPKVSNKFAPDIKLIELILIYKLTVYSESLL